MLKREQMSAHTMETIVDRIDTLPMLPAMVNRVMEVIYDPESSPQDLSQVIQQDQALTATILKFANSAFFGFSRKVGTIKHAVTVLGFAEIQNLVLGQAVCNTFKTMNAFERFDLNRFWEHSFVCGLAATIIGGRQNRVNKDYFVAGLIHDVGKLVLFLFQPEVYIQIIERTGAYPNHLTMLEKEAFGFSHDDVGMKLVEKWLFPDNLVAAVGYHHDPLASGKQVMFSTVIHMADILTHLHHLVKTGIRKNVIQEEPEFMDRLSRTIHHGGVNWDMNDMGSFFDQLTQMQEEESDVMAAFL